MKKYRKIPLTIEAMQYNEVNDFRIFPPDLLFIVLGKEQALFIETLEGAMRCNIGDYIVRGIKGEYYPVNKDIFEESYEEIE